MTLICRIWKKAKIKRCLLGKADSKGLLQHFPDPCRQCLLVVKLFRVLRDRLQHVPGRGVVAKSLTHVDEEVLISGRKHKAAAQLQRIFSQTMLLMSGGLSAPAGLHVVSAEQMKQGGVAQADSFVGETLVIDQKGKLDAGLFPKEPGITHITQPNHSQASAFRLELFFEFAQLRDVLTAEDSTVVAKEDQHRRSALPQGTEACWVAIGVR
jgi:hypothetical protein